TGAPAQARRASWRQSLTVVSARSDMNSSKSLASEIAGHRGEAHIGHRIQRAQRVHHQLADLRRRELAFAGTLPASHAGPDHARDALGVDRPLASGHLDRARELVAVEGDALAVLFHHREFAQLHALEGGEARAAGRAVASPADRRVVVGRSRVLHLGVLVTAEWTAHLLPRLVSCASS